MHITIQTISIWTKHQSKIIKPKPEPLSNQTKNRTNPNAYNNSDNFNLE